MGNNKKSNANFLVQGSILAMASIISRVIGLIYRIPLTAIIGNKGNDYYGCAFEIYNILLIISSYSLPLAVSKLVSADLSVGRKKNVSRILKCALAFGATTGMIAALILFFGAEYITGTIMKTPYSIFAVKVLAPGLVIVAVLGVMRGFFQGLGTMVPTAVSQIVEQIINAAVSIGAAYVLFHYGLKIDAVLGTKTAAYAYGAAGSTLGTGLGALSGLLFLAFLVAAYRHVMRRKMAVSREERREESTAEIYYMLILTIMPVILSTAVYNLSGIIDQGIFKHLMALKNYDSMGIDELWGIYSGEYKLLTNVPIAVASAMASSTIPVLTRARIAKDRKEMRRKTENAIRFVMVICIPCAVGLSVLATPILTLLFGAKDHLQLSALLLQTGSLSVVLYGMSTLTNGILQGMDKMRLPVIHAAISLALHVVLLVVLLMVTNLNIHTVVWANIFFAFLMCVLNSRSIAKYMRYRQEVRRTFFVPLLASALMGAAAFGVYHGLYVLCKSNAISVLAACIAAVIVYGVALLALKGLTEEELLGFPKGRTLVRIVKKLHLM